jgi:hypothetical protein
MSNKLPQRIPGTTAIPASAVSCPSLALLVRVAAAMDQWAEHDRRRDDSARVAAAIEEPDRQRQ